VIIAPSTGLGGFVEVGERAFISGGVMVHQFVRIGCYAMIGGNAKITQDALPYMITDGVPATVRGLNLVGLRRGGFDRAAIRGLKQAYGLIHRAGLARQPLLDALRQLGDAQAAQLASFIAASRRGYHQEKHGAPG
jgi:UDP-N-acetylglucosamine acyltransferase